MLTATLFSMLADGPASIDNIDKSVKSSASVMHDIQSRSQRVGWACCLDHVAGTHFTIMMQFAHARQTLMYTAMSSSCKDTSRRELAKAIAAGEHICIARYHQPSS